MKNIRICEGVFVKCLYCNKEMKKHNPVYLSLYMLSLKAEYPAAYVYREFSEIMVDYCIDSNII